jgi:hypothetical protein
MQRGYSFDLRSGVVVLLSLGMSTHLWADTSPKTPADAFNSVPQVNFAGASTVCTSSATQSGSALMLQTMLATLSTDSKNAKKPNEASSCAELASGAQGPNKISTITLDGECPKPGAPIELSCSALTTGTGATKKFNGDALKKSIDSVWIGVCSARCTQGKLEALEKEIACMSSQAQELQRLIGTLKPVYDSEVARTQAWVTQANAYIADLQTQGVNVDKYLDGDPTTASSKDPNKNVRPGLRAIQEKAVALKDALPGQLKAWQEAQLALNNRQKQFEEDKPKFRNGRITACVSQYFSQNAQSSGGAASGCRVNSGSASVLDRLVCEYGQGLIVSEKLTREEKNAAANIDTGEGCERATTSGLSIEARRILARTCALRRSLEGIVRSMPTQVSSKGDRPAEMDSESSFQYATAADFAAQMGATLSTYSSRRDLKSELTQMFSRCEARATQELVTELKSGNSWLFKSEQSLAKDQKTQNESVQGLINQYSSAWREMNYALTGNYITPSWKDSCDPTKNSLLNPAGQEKCIQGVQTQLDIMTTQDYAPGSRWRFGFPIKGTGGRGVEIVQCNSLNTCIDQLSKKKSALINQVQMANQQKNTTISSFYASMGQFLSKRGTDASGKQTESILDQANAMQNRLETIKGRINANLGKLVGGSSITTQCVSPEEAQQPTSSEAQGGQPAQDQIKGPKNILAYVGGQMTPCLWDLAQDPFKVDLKSAIESAQTKESEAGQKTADLMKKVDECKEKAKEKRDKAEEAKLASLDKINKAGMCAWAGDLRKEICGDDQGLGAVAVVLSTQGFEIDYCGATGSLKTGISPEVCCMPVGALPEGCAKTQPFALEVTPALQKSASDSCPSSEDDKKSPQDRCVADRQSEFVTYCTNTVWNAPVKPQKGKLECGENRPEIDSALEQLMRNSSSFCKGKDNTNTDIQNIDAKEGSKYAECLKNFFKDAKKACEDVNKRVGEDKRNLASQCQSAYKDFKSKEKALGEAEAELKALEGSQ